MPVIDAAPTGDACAKRHKWCNCPGHNHCVRCWKVRHDHD